MAAPAPVVAPPTSGVKDPAFVINATGLALVKSFEGLYLKAYQDSVGVWTIGYGRIEYDGGSPVQQGDYTTQEKSDQWLLEDLEKDGAHYVRAWIKVPLNENQFSALTSFTFNRGAGRLHEKLVAILNSGDYAKAADTLLEYNYAGSDNRVLAGLTRRRKAERELFLGRDWKIFDE